MKKKSSGKVDFENNVVRLSSDQLLYHASIIPLQTLKSFLRLTLNIANFLIIWTAISSLQTSLIAVALHGGLLAVDGARGVASYATSLGVGTLAVAPLPVKVVGVRRLGAEAAVDDVDDVAGNEDQAEDDATKVTQSKHIDR